MTENRQLKIDECEIDQIGKVAVAQFRESHISNALQIEELGLELYRLIEEDSRKRLVLDFSQVKFFSSAAIGKLISANGKVKARNGTMKLCNISPEILDVLRTCKLDRVFDIRQDGADAMSSFES